MIESGVLGTLRIRKYERCSVGGNGIDRGGYVLFAGVRW